MTAFIVDPLLTRSVCVFLVAVAVAWLSVGLLIPILRRRDLLDVPNDRSSHTLPTPRGGGIGILAAILVAMLVARLCGLPVPHAGVWLGLALVAGVSVVDDLRGGIGAGVR